MEMVSVRKELIENFVVDVEKLLTDFERILDVSLQSDAENRLHELSSGEVKSFSEGDYKAFIRKMGIKDD